MRRPLLRAFGSLLAAALVAAAAMPTGCALGDTTGTGGSPGTPCRQGHDAECEDGNPCHVGTCNADGLCETANLKHDPPDTQGDCKVTHCHEGVADTKPDPGDPEDDGDACTTDTCNPDGTTQHTHVPDGGDCTEQGHAGVCRSGKCRVPCQHVSDCDSKNDCIVGACDLSTDVCDFTALDGVMAPGKQTPGDCRSRVCVMGKVTGVDTPEDLPTVDECWTPLCTPDDTQPGHPLAPGKTPKPARASCMNGGMICDGHGDCVDCVDGTDCTGGGSTCTGTTQTNHDCNASGHCVDGAMIDCTPYECKGNACGSNCSSDADCTPGNFCIVGVGTCGKKPLGTGCLVGIDCQSGNCVDGVCCDSSCGSTCRSCNLAGSRGMCSPVPFGQPDGGCGGAQVCDGSGNCRSANGQTCGGGGSCASGNCADGVCCNNACTGICKRCNATPGTCTTIGLGGTDGGSCDATHGCSNQPCVCDSSGGCSSDLGATCSIGSTCASTHCSTDHHCCSSSCGVCSTCAGGNCSKLGVDTQQNGFCDDNNGGCGAACACNGAGACKLKSGQHCTADPECSTGVCQTNHKCQ